MPSAADAGEMRVLMQSEGDGGASGFCVLRQVQQGKEVRRSENDHLAVRLELEKVKVPADDVGGCPGDGAF